MSTIKSMLFTVGAILSFGAGSSYATVLNVSTGLDPSDVNILVGNTPDAHWTVDQFGGGIAPAKVVAPGNAGGAFPIWAANGPGSSWITVDPNSVGNAPTVPYSYYRKFTLTPADLVTVNLAGTWGIDDGGDLRLNGNLLSSLPADYSASTPFSAGAGSGFFVPGVNLLTITMTSSDNVYEAVRLEGNVRTASVPDSGSTLVMLNASMVGIFAIHRFKNRNR